MVETNGTTGDSKAVSGNLDDFNIFDITQSLMMSRKTCQVTVQSGSKQGYIYFKEGQIVAALDDDLNIGEQAAFKIFYWRGGSFSIAFGVEAQERNIKLDTENLMLEVARHMDEAKRDADVSQQPQAQTPTKVAEEFEDKFKTELHKIFKRVASETTPSRDRYTVRAFDSLLVALNDLSGTALFLRPDSRPRVKTAKGFETIKQETIAANEIEGFLNALLSPKEREIFREEKEITAWHSSREAGTFQVTVFFDYGKPACIFAPSSKSIPPLSRFVKEGAIATTLFETKGGLWLVSGGLARGKSTVLAAIIEEGLRRYDLLVTFFSRNHVYSFSDDRGFIIRSDLARYTLEQDGYLANAVRQGSDVIVVDELLSGAMLRDTLQVSSGQAMVLATLEADGTAEVAERLSSFAAGPRSERVARQLSQNLRGIIEVDLRNPVSDARVTLLPLDDEIRAAVAIGNYGALERLRAPVLAAR